LYPVVEKPDPDLLSAFLSATASFIYSESTTLYPVVEKPDPDLLSAFSVVKTGWVDHPAVEKSISALPSYSTHSPVTESHWLYDVELHSALWLPLYFSIVSDNSCVLAPEEIALLPEYKLFS